MLSNEYISGNYERNAYRSYRPPIPSKREDIIIHRSIGRIRIAGNQGDPRRGGYFEIYFPLVSITTMPTVN